MSREITPGFKSFTKSNISANAGLLPNVEQSSEWSCFLQVDPTHRERHVPQKMGTPIRHECSSLHRTGLFVSSTDRGEGRIKETMVHRASEWLASLPGSKGGAVVRALASHQCGPRSNPGVNAICGLSLLLVLSLAPKGFFSRYSGFPLSSETNTSKFQFDLERTDTIKRVHMNS